MALRRLLSKRLVDRYTVQPPAINLDDSSALFPQNATKTKFHREYLTSPDSAEKGFFRRFFHRRAMNQLPEFLNLPVGDKLREKLINNITSGSDRLHLEGLSPPQVEGHRSPADSYGISVEDARKLLRISQVEKLKARLREIPMSSVSYSEFVQICARECGNQDQGVEFAKMLDQSGYVIVLGDIVFLHPDQVAKTMEKMISQSIAAPNDPRRRQLEQMERQKAAIDQKAIALVRGELYCGLGFLVVQTIGFMRLTFWELSWDVMEPICYFVTSVHFALAYGFFLRTSTEPSFEGYFRRRFKAKQTKLIKIHNFDLQTYNKLRKAFYPNLSSDDHHYSEKYSRPSHNHEKEAFSENMQY